MSRPIRFVAPAVVAGLVACGAATEPGVDDVNLSANGTDASSSASADGADARATVDAARESGTHDELDAARSADAMADAPHETGMATVCTAVEIPAGVESGGAACSGGASGSCFPHDETAFSPVWIPPLPLSHSCTTTQIADYYSECAGPTATGVACTAWRNAAANVSCFSCLNTPSSASAYGVFILFPGNVVELNVAGCVALAEPCNLPCAETWLASAECREAACALAYCPEQSEQIACATSADACTACDTYAQASACLTELTGPDHPAAAVCAIGSTATPTEGQYTAVATFMCGP